MADTVNTQTLEQGIRNVVMEFTNVSDGTGESLVTKVDPSTLSPPCARVKIRRIKYSTIGMGVEIYWDGAVDKPAWIIPPDKTDEICFEDAGGLFAPIELAAPTGKLLFSTRGEQNGASYSIILEMSKKYEAAQP